MYTVFDRTYGNLPAKNTVFLHHIYPWKIRFGQPYIHTACTQIQKRRPTSVSNFITHPRASVVPTSNSVQAMSRPIEKGTPGNDTRIHTRTHAHTHTHSHIHRVGQNRIYTPYMTVYLMISLPKVPYIHRIYMGPTPGLIHNTVQERVSVKTKFVGWDHASQVPC